MTKIQNTKKYDLEDRTFNFAQRVINYINSLPQDLSNREISKQLIRASGSVGANYIEANESLGKKDFAMRIRISRKEAKESRFWLNLTKPQDKDITERSNLIQESTELMKIFGSILEKTK